jgi:DNA excision repair protein ERCC-3
MQTILIGKICRPAKNSIVKEQFRIAAENERMDKTREDEREKLYEEFRQGRIKILVVSKVANFAVDLPDASVMIQVSGAFGSRQEEAQRLGRILRPKERASHFYTLVSKGTVEQSFGSNRQLFLVEQGYRYQIRYF